MENLAKSAFSSFCSIRWKFFKQTPLQSKNSKKFSGTLSKMIILEVFVLKVDLCIKVVELFKIMTVFHDGHAISCQDHTIVSMNHYDHTVS